MVGLVRKDAELVGEKNKRERERDYLVGFRY